jgi:hypothetical protein
MMLNDTKINIIYNSMLYNILNLFYYILGGYCHPAGALRYAPLLDRPALN